MVTRAPQYLLLTRAARAAWWCGLPFLLLGHLVLGRESYQFDPFYDVADAIWTTSPLAAELIARYHLSMIAMLLLTAMMLWSHYRGVAIVRVESLALPAYIAGIEAFHRQSGFLSCSGRFGITLAEVHKELYVAAPASVITMAAPLLLGAIVKAKSPLTLSGSFSKRSLLPVVAAIVSIALIWLMYDLMLRGVFAPQGP